MSLCEALKITRNEVGLSKHIPYTHLLSPTMVETKDGMVMSVIKIKGIAFATEQDEKLNYYHDIWHRLLNTLDERISLYVTTHHRKVSHQLSGNFTQPFLQRINDKYMCKFSSRNIFANDIYITFIFRGIHSGKFGAGIKLVKNINKKVIKEAREHFRSSCSLELEKIVKRSMAMISEFGPTLLGSNDNRSSELLNFLATIVNAEYQTHFPAITEANPISRRIKDHADTLKKYPDGNLSQYLGLKRLFFGDNLYFQGSSKSKDRLGAMLCVKSFPDASHSLMLSTLLQLDCEWFATHSFSFESQDVVTKHVKRHGVRLENTNDDGVSQIMQLSELPDLVQSGQLQVGYYHHSLLVLAENAQLLDDYVDQAAKCYLDVGIPVVRESVGKEPAFWASLPGNIKYIARSSLVTTENFADLCPLYNYRTGYCDNNYLGGAVTILESNARTPFFFNFHLQGNQNNPTPGHTIMIGSNGSGKTVLLTFLDAQLSRYQGRSVFFDRNRGVEIYLRACGGSYSILSPEFPKETCFNPLQLADTPANRSFCYHWLAQLCRDEGKETIVASQYELIKQCIDYAFENLSDEYRQLSYAVTALPIDFCYWPQLRRWLRANGKYEDGEYAYIFDNETDALKAKEKMGFDMTHFLDHEPAGVRTAVMMYLFHWVKQLLDGDLLAIYLDEAWQYFSDEYWIEELRRSIPTFRKRNGFLVMATQSAASIVDSPLTHIILDNCATQIFFPNPEANEAHYVNGFSLTDSEFFIIKNNYPKSRLFLVKQSGESNLCCLDLAGLDQEIAVLSASEKSVRALDKLRDQYGDNPDKWLPVFLKKVGDL